MSATGDFGHTLTVKFLDDAHVRADGTQAVTSTSGHKCAGHVGSAAASLGFKLVPVLQDMGPELEALARRAEKMSGVQQPDLRSLVSVELAVPDAEHLVAAASWFDASPCVEYVSIKRTEIPLPPTRRNASIMNRCHTSEPTGGGIPDFTEAQGYARAGQLDADYLHSLGADGSGIMYADCEFSMNFQHQEFRNSRITEEANFPVGNNQRDHGTASVGIALGGDGFGIKGLANKADGYFFSELPASGRYNRARAVAAAVAKVRAGDVVLLEMQTGRPYGPAELSQSIWNIVKMGADAGVVVVAAAGNGNRNLDGSQDAAYRARGDSGSIIIGAGTPSHSKASFSTNGSRVDVQAWGDWTVMTSGYGKCTGFTNSNTPGYRYTSGFAGTSSASAITAAALTLFQSWALKELGAPLTPLRLRDILRSTGHPQRGGGGNIGPHTNLRAALEAARGGGPSPSPPTPPTPPPTPPPPPTPTPPAGSCEHQKDCDVNPWCRNTGYEAWCRAQGQAGVCPSPYCVRSASLSAHESPPQALGTIPVGVRDCGGSRHIARIGDYSPKSVETGTTTTFKATATLSKYVRGGKLNLEAAMTGFPYSGLASVRNHNICQPKTIELRTWYLWCGTIKFRGLDCPVSSGQISLDFELTVNSALPAGRAHMQADVNATASSGEPLLCATIETSR